MVDPATTRRWAFRGLFVGVAAATVFLDILPLSTTPTRIPGPDLLIAFAYAWLLRRPDYVPAALLAGVFLLADMIYLRPPGLWAALALVGAEILRRRQPVLRDLPFAAEWATVAGVVAAVMLGYHLALGLALLPQPGLGLVLLQLAATLLAYPVAVFVSRTALGVRVPRTRGGHAAAGGRA